MWTEISDQCFYSHCKISNFHLCNYLILGICVLLNYILWLLANLNSHWFYFHFVISLSVLFSGLNERDPILYEVYTAQLQVAIKGKLINEIRTDLDEVKNWLVMWGSDEDKKRQIYRLLYKALFEENCRYDGFMEWEKEWCTSDFTDLHVYI